jgi:hypothetical protein
LFEDELRLARVRFFLSNLFYLLYIFYNFFTIYY